MRSPNETFPGHNDAGKVLDWIRRQISLSALGKCLQSAPQEQCDALSDFQSTSYQPEEH